MAPVSTTPGARSLTPTATVRLRQLVYGFVSLKAAWLAGGERRKRGTPPADAFKQLSKQLETWFLARYLTAVNHMENGGCCSRFLSF